MFLASGEVVFEDTAPFDEKEVLSSNTDYLLTTLDLVGIEFKYADESEARIQEDCCPQEPFIVYRVDQWTPSLQCINQQPLIPAFEMSMPVTDNETVADLAGRLVKELRMDKGIFECNVLFDFSNLNPFLFRRIQDYLYAVQRSGDGSKVLSFSGCLWEAASGRRAVGHFVGRCGKEERLSGEWWPEDWSRQSTHLPGLVG